MPELREVELRIAVAEGVLSRAEAEALGEEARRKKQSPLALLVEQGRLSEDSFQSILAEAMNDPVWRAAGADASASTYTMENEPPPPSEPPFPVAGWDRYTSVRFLGQGGMGMVFLAIDTRLRREVAIKFVRGNNADHVRRLISEARNQARVSHERICKVYEVDEVEGKVYIAMQYIAGKPLGRMADELTLEQKLTLVRGAAEGIHAAHSEGIIHRDIKPSNIMIERHDDGELRPYVMDFGLARSAQDVGETQTGAVIGTPRYMSPEQAQGATSKLDRRADVYSLGATLYHLVTGEPAVPGETVAEVIHNLIELEPRPLRAHDPGVPVDLEAIVLKCLEKDRSARYDSARALADDLGRFLNGEPVIARPADTWYRLRKRLAKHRRLVAAAAVALAALVVAIGWAITTRLAAAEREQFARRFTERVGQIEARALYSALAPRHDIRGDQAELRARMREIEDEIQLAGEVAAGPGHYALGRGYLALGDDEQARDKLEAAWREGFREPQAAYALALALGHLYQQGLLAAERMGDDKARRETKQREIEHQYRQPALDYLAKSRGAEVLSPEYVAALVSFYENHLDEALHHVDAIGGGQAWSYEIPQLRGDILLQRALGFRRNGDRERARTDFEAGRKAYAAAVAVGESVPAVYESLAELERAAMSMEMYGQGDVMPPFNRALVATAHALEVAPDHYEALVLEAKLRCSLAEHEALRGLDVEELLAAALDDALRAVEISPVRSEARLEMARIYRQWGGFRNDRHDDPSEQFQKAVTISDAIPDQDRDAQYYFNLGVTFTLWAIYNDQSDADAQANRTRAIDALSRALNGGLNEARINLGINLFKRASQPRAPDPDGDLRRTIEVFDAAKSIDAKNWVPYFYTGQSYQLMAQRARTLGRDPSPDLQRALDEFQGGIAINPKVPNLYNSTGAVFQDQANLAWERGTDPTPLLDQAYAAFQRATEVAPKQVYAYGNIGQVFAQRAWFQRARDEDPTAHVHAAVAALNQALERVSNDPSSLSDLGMVYAILAGYELEHGRDPRPSLDRASAAIDAALGQDGNDAEAQLHRAEVLGIRARLQARQGNGKAESFAAAADAFQKTIELAPENQDDRIVFGHFCRAWAAFQRESRTSPRDVLQRGLSLIQPVLDHRPTWPDALVLRASLRLAVAQDGQDAAEARQQAESARKDFADALSANHMLSKVWASQAALAQQLAAPR